MCGKKIHLEGKEMPHYVLNPCVVGVDKRGGVGDTKVTAIPV